MLLLAGCAPEGTPAPTAPWLPTDLEGAAAHTFTGALPGQLAGIPAGFADVDGDGRADVLFGAQGEASDVQCAWGRMYVHLAADLSGDRTDLGRDASLTVHGPAWECVGFSVAGIGDADGDGLEDLVIGTPYLPAGLYGHVYVVLGASVRDARVASLLAADVTWHGDGENELGRSVAAPGDVDGDGRPDLLVGAPNVNGTGPGAAYVLVEQAPGTRDVAEAAFTLTPDPDHGRTIGWTTAGGDLDGDGLADVVADWPAPIVAFAGDLDGGGRGDLLLGEGDTADADVPARVSLLLGEQLPASGGLEEDTKLVLFQEETGAYQGFGMVGDRDVDGDGRPDAIVGTSGSAAAEGVAYLLLGW